MLGREGGFMGNSAEELLMRDESGVMHFLSGNYYCEMIGLEGCVLMLINDALDFLERFVCASFVIN